MSVEQLFTLLLTMQLTKRAPHLEGVVTMYEDLHWGDVKQLGLERLTTNQVRYLFDRVCWESPQASRKALLAREP